MSTPLVLAILVIEDLVMAGFLPLSTVLLVGGGIGRVLLSVLVAALVVIVVLTVAWRWGPAISRAIFSRSDEALLFEQERDRGVDAVAVRPGLHVRVVGREEAERREAGQRDVDVDASGAVAPAARGVEGVGVPAAADGLVTREPGER